MKRRCDLGVYKEIAMTRAMNKKSEQAIQSTVGPEVDCMVTASV